MILMPLFLLACVGFLGWVRSSTTLAYFQQEEYDNVRFLRAWPDLSLIDFKFTTAVIFLSMLSVLMPLTPFVPAAAGGGALAIAILERRMQTNMKKPLVWTHRARRLWRFAFVFWLVAAVILVLAFDVFGAALAMQMVPLAILLANSALAARQRADNQVYLDQAKAKLMRYPGTTIGITGSFGKTTVKHILGDVLGQLSTVFFSSGSINTPLGHTRHIRQRLQPAHRYFVAEMGAYGEGSIERLCDLIDPDHAIITSIGLAHNERFKGLDVVARAKSELAQWVANKGSAGRIVMTQDVASYQPFADIVRQVPDQCIIVGDNPDAPHDFLMRGVVADANGTALTLSRPGEADGLPLTLPLLGSHNRDNLALVAALLLSLNWAPEAIQAALGGVRHVPHRLAPRPGPNGSTILDDAYNANPVGMRSAFDLARQMADSAGGKAYVITPGLVELGDRHDEEHLALGRHAGERLDKCYIVTPERVPALVEGVEAVGGVVETASSYLAARAAVDPDLAPGDVLLVANDLPDLLGSRVWL